MELERMCPLLLAALVAACYTNSLRCGLVFDDLPAVRDNRDLRPSTSLTKLFEHDYWGMPIKKEGSHKSYRPLTVLTFRANYALHGVRPFGYHLANVLLHFIVCLLFYRLCLHFSSAVSSTVSSALFAVHPVHTEAVTGTVGRAELLSAIAFLGAFLCYLRARRAETPSNAWQDCGVTSLLAFVGLLCKEQALTVLLICCIYEIISPKKERRVQSLRMLMLGRVSPWLKDRLLRVSLLLGAALVALYLRCKCVGPRVLPAFGRFDNPAAASATPSRQLTYNYLMSLNAWLLLFPNQLCCDWSGGSVTLLRGYCDLRNAATLAFYTAAFLAVRALFRLDEEARTGLIMSVCLAGVPFLPASNLLFPVGFVVAERVLYIPSMGFCMMVAHGWTCLWERRACKQMAAAGIVFLIAIHVLKTMRRNEDWRNEHSLYRAGLDVNPRNAKLHNNMGRVLESIDRHEDALMHYATAVQTEPEDVRGHLNMGRVLTYLRRYEEAEGIYRKAKSMFWEQPGQQEQRSVTPNHLQLFLNLAFLISRNDSRLNEADALYQEAITLRSDFTNAYLNRGDVLLKMNRTKEAEEMYQRAIQIDGTNPDLFFNLGVVLMDQGRSTEALEYFNRALHIEPDHERSLELSAVLIHESGMSRHKSLARDRLERVVDRGAGTERVYVRLGLLALDSGDVSGAERCFRKALQKRPECREALFNLALLLSERSSPAEARDLLEVLLLHQPDHINGLILLADIHVNHQRNLEAAEECYRRVLALEATHPKALHNLCVLHFERQELPQAERCFAHALTLHPSVPYIKHHLQLVRDLLERGTVFAPHSIS